MKNSRNFKKCKIGKIQGESVRIRKSPSSKSNIEGLIANETKIITVLQSSSKEQINKLNNEEKVDYTDHSFVEDEDLLLSDDTAYELDDSPAGGSGFGNMFSDLYSKDKKE
jgi:hypothetical protein